MHQDGEASANGNGDFVLVEEQDLAAGEARTQNLYRGTSLIRNSPSP